MENTKLPVLNNIILESLNQAMSYQQYKNLVANLVIQKSTTGREKTDALVNYTRLNDKRMRRWDKTVTVPENVIETLKGFKNSITWIVLTESWCGDAAHIMPIINKVADLNDRIDFKVVLRDDNQALMNQFLTNGGQSIPKLIAIDNRSNEVINTFGPRPAEATQMVNEYKKKHGTISPEFKEDLQRWYNTDKGQSTLVDLLKLLDY
jgi:thiol-disulfide isomerase/thioredoxin